MFKKNISFLRHKNNEIRHYFIALFLDTDNLEPILNLLSDFYYRILDYDQFDNKSLWRNWLARSAVNRKVDGSNPSMDEFFLGIQ